MNNTFWKIGFLIESVLLLGVAALFVYVFQMKPVEPVREPIVQTPAPDPTSTPLRPITSWQSKIVSPKVTVHYPTNWIYADSDLTGPTFKSSITQDQDYFSFSILEQGPVANGMPTSALAYKLTEWQQDLLEDVCHTKTPCLPRAPGYIQYLMDKADSLFTEIGATAVEVNWFSEIGQPQTKYLKTRSYFLIANKQTYLVTIVYPKKFENDQDKLVEFPLPLKEIVSKLELK